MPILIVGGPSDGDRINVTEDPPTIVHGGKTLVRRAILITNHDDRREEIVLYTPPDLSLADIFRQLVCGYRRI